MLKKMIALSLALLMIISMVPVTLAAGDTTIPKLVDIRMNKTDYTVGDAMVITLQIEEKESGLKLDRCTVEFAAQDGSNKYFSRIESLKKSDQADDIYIAEQTLTKDSGPTGSYKISKVILEDNSGNSNQANFTTRNIPAGSQYLFSFTNDQRTDWTGPILQSISTSPDIVKVGEAASVIVTAEDVSGLAQDSTIVFMDGKKHYFPVGLKKDGAEPGKLAGTSAPIPSDMPTGDYFAEVVILEDALGNVHIYDYSEGTLPSKFREKITVINENDPVEYPHAVINKIDISSMSVKQGDSFDITVTIDPKGNPLPNSELWSYVFACNGAEYDIVYKKVSEGVYSAHVSFPVNYPTGYYTIYNVQLTQTNQSGSGSGYFMSWAEPGRDVNGTFIDSSGQFWLKLNVTPIFSGTDNVSVLQGNAFDPMAGVGAANDTEGGMTAAISVETPAGFSTDNVGIYLFKYKIKSAQTDYNGNPRYYYDFRWVGVTELLPGDTGTGTSPLVVTDGSIAVGASNSDASVSLNGAGIAFASKLSAAGNYSISVKTGGGSSASALARSSAATGGPSKYKANFAIDHSAPVITATTTGMWPGKVNVSVKAKDQSGTSLTKWSKGVCTLNTMRKTGTAFHGTFTVTSFGKYTVYAKDIFGHDNITVIDVKYVKVSSIKLSCKSLRMVDKSTAKLSATIRPSNATYKQVTWSSGNTAVATVDKYGNVKAIGVGTTTIYARSTNGYCAKCKVTVKPLAVVKVTLSRTTLSLAVGGTAKLIATVTPANATYRSIRWSSSKTSIATVDKTGKIKALKKGSCYVYAKTSNGKWARCLVTVK